MNARILAFLFVCLAMPSLASAPAQAEWGFFGHRMLNRMAVFTLPPELIVFFKKHIEWITEHAVDPDKRRYATRFEAIRHYIDIDHWGEYPFPNVPREWPDALGRYLEVYALKENGDTLRLWHYEDAEWGPDSLLWAGSGEMIQAKPYGTSKKDLRVLVQNLILPQYYEEEWVIQPDTFSTLLGLDLPGDILMIRAVDHFSEYGIVPYFLPQMQNRLTAAFREGQLDRILRLSAEIGHYIGDASVPLHTTENYNGQLTNQIGIHAFWESRIPELFAENEFNSYVGKAAYIENPKDYFWDIVLTSHSYVDSVLAIEKRLSQTFPSDQQFCYDQRLGQTVRIQCQEYAAAYREAMGGMVESRWRATIKSIGSSWYTAWIDAGQPDLLKITQEKIPEREKELEEELDAAYRTGLPKGRKHEN